MANIPGISGYSQPGVFSRVRSIRRAISIPGGLRILALIGLGQAEETIVLSAEGGGIDGVNPDFSGSNAPDGRHFELSKSDLIERRTTILLDGIPLSGVEGVIDTNSFSEAYDYRLEPLTGRLELQSAHLAGTAVATSGNSGNGTVVVTLLDKNAPSETWTIRASSVIRDAYGDPIADNATFTAIGSVSGQPVDINGAPIVFLSDGSTTDNGILELTITEGLTAFDRGDSFTVSVVSGVLLKGQTLEAKYIAAADVNDPEFFVDANALFAKHGFPTETNTLSLGAQMAFENGAFGVMALQAKPLTPRRTIQSFIDADDPLTTGVEGLPAITLPVGSGDLQYFMHKLDAGGLPDSDTDVHFFVVHSDGSETQIFPNKQTFYSTIDPYSEVTALQFVNKTSSYALLNYSYTVFQSGADGYVIFTNDLIGYNSAQIAVGDGLRVSYVDTKDASFFDTNWGEALEQLETVDCQIVVPLPDASFSAVQQAVVAHCELMSNTANQRERFSLVGAPMGVTSEALLGRELVAVEDIDTTEGVAAPGDSANYDVRVNFGSTYRTMYFWPDEIIRSINGSNTSIHGFYMAAAAGGLLAATANVAIPLTRKVLTGFTVPRSKMRKPIIVNALGDRGVSVVIPVTGGGQILHGKTTTASGDPLEEEPSVIFIRDRTAQVLRDAVRGFIGQPEDPTLAASITSSIVKSLQALAFQGLLTDYKNLSVARDQVDPRQWNVSVEVQPTLPVNWIFIDISVGML